MDLEVTRPKRNATPRFLLICVAFLCALMMISSSVAAEAKLETVYHVYMDGTYVGTVSDKDVVENTIEKLINKQRDTYKDFNFELGNKLTYISEQVFRSNADNAAVETKVNELATVKAVATAIMVDGKAVTYVKDTAEAEKVINDIKLQYVSKEELTFVNMLKATKEKLPEIKKDESRVLNVSINEPLFFKDEKTDPKNVLSYKDAVKLLQKGTLEEKKHVVEKGEALEIIAKKYDLSMKQIKELNKGITEDSIIQIGQELNTVVTKPLVHVAVDREKYQEETVAYETEVIEDNSMPKGETKVKQEGKNGKNAFVYKIKEVNGQQTKKEVIKETVLEKPVKQITIKGTKVIPSRGSGSFTWPTNGGYVSSGVGQRWGAHHKGIDIARPSNYTIKAADNGVVVEAGWNNGGYGNKIVIDHQNGYRTVYAHLSKISVSVGQKVEKGSAIGIMGSTGNSTGTHLHFEVYQNGQLRNPLSFF
ncbi:peptidoglycan DD-metalloendopeptidase family protein [Lederbergia wuyishanensis]|uniref:Murein DD-endopeptidase MepM/ murein hydrolase activator NlpD n=1 Tax=Lederbergia wuyishanensis TaxID=1347903 RepID=A0ABU0D275_9BACI|nr:M23 family metallopeptidase [Lederbergia wuyishanensis]MCJ8007322.1 M23 family metallopeptidase [Lederbergia wuyishanensis]MDQ0342514.1 murein DD-endopeptidase MepM/ murein hydrolase activator NlpD [Lederbergia wuyishanensis]